MKSAEHIQSIAGKASEAATRVKVIKPMKRLRYGKCLRSVESVEGVKLVQNWKGHSWWKTEAFKHCEVGGKGKMHDMIMDKEKARFRDSREESFLVERGSNLIDCFIVRFSLRQLYGLFFFYFFYSVSKVCRSGIYKVRLDQDSFFEIWELFYLQTLWHCSCWNGRTAIVFPISV